MVVLLAENVGEELMRALARHAESDNLHLIRWELEGEDAGARQFYQRLGATVRPRPSTKR